MKLLIEDIKAVYEYGSHNEAGFGDGYGSGYGSIDGGGDGEV